MTNIVVYAIGAAAIVLLLAILWKRIIRAILLLAGLGLAGTLAWAFAQQAIATKQVATAATVAARGSAAGNVAMVMVLGMIVIGAVVLGYVYLRWRLARGGDTASWTDTPYQLENRNDPAQQVHMLVQIEVLRALRELRTPPTTALMSVPGNDDDNNTNAMIGWW